MWLHARRWCGSVWPSASTLYRLKNVFVLFLGIAIGFHFYFLQIRKIKYECELESQTHLKCLPEEKYKSMITMNGIWFVPKSICDCAGVDELTVYKLEDHIDKDELASIAERRKKAFTAFRKRYPIATREILIAQPNTPLSYPIQGAEVMPLHTIVIPGLGFHETNGTRKYQVVLKASLGVLNTFADVSEAVIHGRGEKKLTICTSSRELLNCILTRVTYTNTKYLLEAVDVVTFSAGTHLVRFPVTIRQPPIPKLFDPGPDNNIASLVTVTTKTFLRYYKLRILIKSLRQYYPNIKLIVADDSEHPEKIEETNVEHYIMPFGKGWFAGRNLAISQVTTKYYLWVDDDYLFTKNTKIEKLVDVLENSDLDVVGGSVNQQTYSFTMYYEEGEENSCLHIKSGFYHHLEGFPNCMVTSSVVNFFLARTEETRRVGFDPKLHRVAHTEFFIDGLGLLRIGTCNDVSIGHQREGPEQSDHHQVEVERIYALFRNNSREVIRFKMALHYFKNRLKCITRG